MKRIFLVLLSLIINFGANAQTICGELTSIIGESSNGQTSAWLFKSFPSNYSELPETIPDGELCDFGIKITENNAQVGDSAVYRREHNDPDEIRFRFVLDTTNLLKSFTDGDSMTIYKFVSYKVNGGSETVRHLNILLDRKETVGNEDNWQIVLKWFSDIRQLKSSQKIDFKTSDNFIEFEFFWKNIDQYSTSGVYQSTYTQTGVIITKNENTKPILMISPYKHVKPDGNFEGFSRLGYKNANSNPSVNGDEIRIVSPIVYQTN